MMKAGTDSISNDSEMSDCVSASTCARSRDQHRTIRGAHPTYLEDEELGVLPAQLQHDVVHLLAWLCPWCPEVDQGDPFEISRQELLEVLGRGDLADVLWRCDGHGCFGGTLGRRRGRGRGRGRWWWWCGRQSGGRSLRHYSLGND